MEMEKDYLVKIFYSYAHEDKVWLDELEKHLKGSRHVSHWHDSDILPGAEWSNEIDAHLNTADIILLLISPDFKNSPYCTKVEMQRALERKLDGEAEVIPILVRTIYWENPPYKNLQMLPRDVAGVNKALDLSENKYEACARVVADIYRTINSIIQRREQLEAYVANGDRFISTNKFQDAQNEYKRALALSPRDAVLYEKLGKVCMRLRHYKEALEAYENALTINGNSVRFWRGKCDALLALGKAIDAKEAFLEAIKRDTQNAFLFKEYGDILVKINCRQEAIEAYDRAISLNSSYGLAYAARANVYKNMAAQFLELARKDQERAKQLGVDENAV